MEQKKDRREAVRIDDYLPFEYEVLQREEYEKEIKMFPKTSSGIEQLELRYPLFCKFQYRYRIEEEISPTEQAILDLLVIINNKLDTLIRLMKKEIEVENTCLKDPAYINISGRGIMFMSKDPIPVGAFLRLRICIPLFPSFVIPALGKVVRCNKRDSSFYEIGVKVTDIHEDEREALRLYIFIKQRRFIQKCRPK